MTAAGRAADRFLELAVGPGPSPLGFGNSPRRSLRDYPYHMSNTSSTAARQRTAVETTASFPNPAQDYFDGHLSLDRHLIRRPTSTFVLRVTSDALASIGIHTGDELLVDRAIDPAPGRVLVVVVDDERRLGRFDVIDGQAFLATDFELVPLTSDVEPWGVATVLLHHLPLGPAGDRGRRNAAR